MQDTTQKHLLKCILATTFEPTLTKNQTVRRYQSKVLPVYLKKDHSREASSKIIIWNFAPPALMLNLKIHIFFCENENILLQIAR